MLKFAKFMSTIFGRIIRVVIGTALILWGSTLGGATWVVVMLAGAVHLFAGVLNLCIVLPFSLCRSKARIF